MTRRVIRRRRSAGRGTTIVEFVLSTAFIFTPLILGTMMVGMNLVRSIQVTQVNRDAGHMFARGVDFAYTDNRNMLAYLAGGLDLSSSGKSVVILSAILKVGPAECTGCANLGQAVFTRQVRLGNTGLRTSAYGTPTVDSNYNVPNYLTNAGARSINFDPVVMNMNPGDLAYVAETYYRSAELDLPGFMNNSGVFAKGVF